MSWLFCESLLIELHVSRDMTKPTKWVCAQRKLGSAWASAQSDQSSLSAWGNHGSLATHWAHCEYSDQTGRMPRLIRDFAGRTLILLVLSCRGSTVLHVNKAISFEIRRIGMCSQCHLSDKMIFKLWSFLSCFNSYIPSDMYGHHALRGKKHVWSFRCQKWQFNQIGMLGPLRWCHLEYDQRNCDNIVNVSEKTCRINEFCFTL